MIRTAIVGGSAYNAGELLRLLINHPDVEISWVYSAADAGSLITDVHQGLLGETYLRFTDEIDWEDVDVVFLCLPHGHSRRFLEENPVPESVKIIDLSTDYRLPAEDGEAEHDFVYGLSEINRKPMVRGARHVANPGSFAMAIELSLLPFAKYSKLTDATIHVTAVAGCSGDGDEPSTMTHYPWRSENMSVFKPFTHRHVDEVRHLLKSLQPDFDAEILFVPMRGCFSRGLIAVTYFESELPIEEILHMYEDAYSDHNFTFIADHQPDLKDVANTNKCIIYIEKVGSRVVVTAVLDNMLKGGAGTAVHNMNLLFGLSERTGLCLKPSAL